MLFAESYEGGKRSSERKRKFSDDTRVRMRVEGVGWCYSLNRWVILQKNKRKIDRASSTLWFYLIHQIRSETRTTLNFPHAHIHVHEHIHLHYNEPKVGVDHVTFSRRYFLLMNGDIMIDMFKYNTYVVCMYDRTLISSPFIPIKKNQWVFLRDVKKNR